MQTKAFWKSKTLQGLAIAALGIFAPKYVKVINENLQSVIEGVGLLWAAYGRIKAETKLGSVATPTNTQ